MTPFDLFGPIYKKCQNLCEHSLHIPLFALNCFIVSFTLRHCSTMEHTFSPRKLPPSFPTKDNVGATLPTSARPNIVQVGGGGGEALLHVMKGCALI